MWSRIAAPVEIAPRAWVLGVVAVQVGVEEGRIVAQARANLTGGEAEVRALSGSTVVHVTLADGDSGDAPPPPAIAPGARGGAAARLDLYLDGAPLGTARLTVEQLAALPPARAFGHAFCRWLRDGGSEPGCDLTDFLSLAPGQMYGRSVTRAIAVGQTVSFALSLRADGASTAP